MMRYNNIINGLFVIASITAFAACTEDTYDNSAAEGNGVFQFSGLPSIYTRADVSADDDQKAFEAGTKSSYSLSKMTTGILIICRKPQARTQ